MDEGNRRPPGRYVLVPRANGDAPAPGPGNPRMRRYSLARVAVARRSALGIDLHERLEQIAEKG